MILFVADSLFALNPLTLLAAVGCAGGLYLFVRGFRLLTRKRLLLNTPTSKIRSASLGLVEVSGLATGPYTIPAPITTNPCFLYRTTAWRRVEDSRSQEWKKVAEETRHVPFFIDDSTGKLLVDPAGADLDLHRDFCEKYDQIWISRVPERATSFLVRHGITPEGDHFRIEEWTIQPQNPLFIVGRLAENPGVEVRPFSAQHRPGRTSISLQQPSTPQQQVVRLSETPTPVTAQMTQQSKIAAALSKAGITSPDAWAAAGVPYRSPEVAAAARLQEISVNTTNSGAKPQNGSAFDPTPPVILMKGENNPAFLISWRSQSELVSALAWKSSAMIWSGGALALLAVYIVLLQLELL